MSNLISTSLQNSVSDVMQGIFNSFKRDELVRFYKVAKNTIIIEDSNFNSNFGFDKSTQFIDGATFEPEYRDFYIRAWFQKDRTMYKLNWKNVDLKFKQNWGKLKIQLEATSNSQVDLIKINSNNLIKINGANLYKIETSQINVLNYLNSTERFIFLEKEYKLFQGVRRIGALQNFEYYEIVLERTN